MCACVSVRGDRWSRYAQLGCWCARRAEASRGMTGFGGGLGRGGLLSGSQEMCRFRTDSGRCCGRLLGTARLSRTTPPTQRRGHRSRCSDRRLEALPGGLRPTQQPGAGLGLHPCGRRAGERHRRARALLPRPPVHQAHASHHVGPQRLRWTTTVAETGAISKLFRRLRRVGGARCCAPTTTTSPHTPNSHLYPSQMGSVLRSCHASKVVEPSAEVTGAFDRCAVLHFASGPSIMALWPMAVCLNRDANPLRTQTDGWDSVSGTAAGA